MPLARRFAEVRTEHLLTGLLVDQGWDVRRPPQGELLRQHEYKDHDHLLEIFKGRSKTRRGGDGLPEAVLIDKSTLQPRAVIEAKAAASDLMLAIKEATEDYGNACIEAGFSPLAVAVAGVTEDNFAVRVLKWTGKKWAMVTYDGNPIGWIPNRLDIDSIRASSSTEIRPSIPPPEVLSAHADEINRILRESKVTDALRPAIMGAIMLALWQSKGKIRREPEHVLSDINVSCEKAFWKADKAKLAKSLYVDVANETLAVKIRRIISILDRLNVPVLTAEHDYLGQLYETFFRYTGGNTIGQYFTPRHITSFISDLCDIGKDDIVIDPACGTGGFLIAAMNRIMEVGHLSRTQVVKVVKKQLIGYETEPITAALCVANMILRGDGSTGVVNEDCFSADCYPLKKADVALLNPPFPHKDTDTPVEDFVNRGLEALKRRGKLGAVVPMQLLVKGAKAPWRTQLLQENTLNGIITLPEELFQPYASATTNILLLTRGVPHNFNQPVFFSRIENDGYRLRKNVRAPREGSQLEKVLKAYQEHKTIDGLCGWATITPDGEWRPGAYIPAKELLPDEILDEVGVVIRSKTSFTTKFAPKLVALSSALVTSLESKDYRAYLGSSRRPPAVTEGHTIGAYFDIYYGQGELESKDGLGEGLSPVISSSGEDNGCHGFYLFENLIKPPFVTVPRTGSMGMAHVQEWPCGASSDNLLLLPRMKVPVELLYIAAAVIRKERWRFNYGAKITPERIISFPLPVSAELMDAIRDELKGAANVEKAALESAEDVLDARTARSRLAEIKRSPQKRITGSALEKRLLKLANG